MKKDERQVFDVTCALIINEKSQVFAAQRSNSMTLPLKWELPGGKVEIGETPEQCLIREIKEELNIELEIIAGLPPNAHVYPVITIKLIPFVCKQVRGVLTLKEHASFKWLNTNELLDLDWAEADIPIIKNYLISLY